MNGQSSGRSSRPTSKGMAGWTSSPERVRAESLLHTGGFHATEDGISAMAQSYLPSYAVQLAPGIVPTVRWNHLLPVGDSVRRSHEHLLGMDGVARQGDGGGERKRKRRKESLETLKDVYVQLKNLEIRVIQLIEHEEMEELEDLREQEAKAKAQSQALVDKTIHQLYQRHVKEKKRRSRIVSKE